MNIDLGELAEFLVRAKKNTYAADGIKIARQRPGFRELEHLDGPWVYRDSYAGYFAFSGQEIVRFQGKPVWSMAYFGEINPKFRKNVKLAAKSFVFLKKALAQVKPSYLYRGPRHFMGSKKTGDQWWEYHNDSEGCLKDFQGEETINFGEHGVYSGHYIGGLIIPKTGLAVVRKSINTS